MEKLRFDMRLRHIITSISELSKRFMVPEEYLRPMSIGNGTIELPAVRLPGCNMFFDECGNIIMILWNLMDIMDADTTNTDSRLKDYFTFLYAMERACINCIILKNDI